MNTPQNPQLHKHIVSNSCDCFIGFLSGEDIRLSDIKRQVEDVVKLQPELKKYGLLKGEPLTAKQLGDGAKFGTADFRLPKKLMRKINVNKQQILPYCQIAVMGCLSR